MLSERSAEQMAQALERFVQRFAAKLFAAEQCVLHRIFPQLRHNP